MRRPGAPVCTMSAPLAVAGVEVGAVAHAAVRLENAAAACVTRRRHVASDNIELRMEASERGESIRDIILEALTSYFSHKRENKALLKLAEKSFAEWDNPKDSDYDRL